MCGHFLPWLQRNTGFWGLRKRHPQAQAVINVVMFFIFGRKRYRIAVKPHPCPKHECATPMSRCLITFHLSALTGYVFFC